MVDNYAQPRTDFRGMAEWSVHVQRAFQTEITRGFPAGPIPAA